MSIERGSDSRSVNGRRAVRNIAIALLVLACSSMALAAPVIIYSSIPAPLPPNVVSTGLKLVTQPSSVV